MSTATLNGKRGYVVEFDGRIWGPFPDEDACYLFAARVSRSPNDWTPFEIEPPDDAPEYEGEV